MRTHYLIMVVTLAGAAAFLGACSTPTTKIGASCKKDSNCNVAGEKCLPGLVAGMPTGPMICTHSCTGEYGTGGCPPAYDCRSTDMTNYFCYKAPYTVDATSGQPVLFGKTCSGDADCMGTGDPNASPSCRHAEDPTALGKPLAQDPNAYCTGACAVDSDCPIGFLCTGDYNYKTNDPTQFKCLKRTLCDECLINDHCPPDFPSCVPDKNGGHYCTKACTASMDCPGYAQSIRYLSCQPGQDAAGTMTSYCFHVFGQCNGKGQICDPCRNELDCQGQMIAGLHCVTNTQSLERMCTKGCMSDATCAGPNMSTCDNTDIGSASNPTGMSLGLCTGDMIPRTMPVTASPNAGIFSCHL